MSERPPEISTPEHDPDAVSVDPEALDEDQDVAAEASEEPEQAADHTAGSENDPAKPEQDSEAKPTRRDKGKSRQRAEEYRKKQEQENNKTELSEREEWALGRAREIDLFSDEHEALASARERLAEASVKMRRGTLTFSSARAQRRFEKAVEAYKEVRDNFIEQQLEDIDEPLVRKRALAAALSAREDGALMGEEANYYLQKENSRLRNAWEESKSWYKERGRATKMAIGAGAVAVTGVLGGLVAGGAVAGAYAGRASRIYFGREAGRSGPLRNTRQKQEESTLRSSNMEDYQANYQSLRKLRKGSRKIEAEDLAATSQAEADNFLRGLTFNESDPDQVSSAYAEAAEESAAEARDKQKSLALALGGAVLGAGVGYLAESAGGFDGILRDGEGGGAGSDTSGGPEADTSDSITPEQQEQIDSLEEDINEAEEELNNLDEEIAEENQENQELREQLDSTEETAEISEQSQYLYGELAGETLDIDIPEGSNVWDQLEAAVDENMPNADYSEKQRLVGNMLNVMEEQYPGRDLNLVYPGESFSVTLPS